MQADDQLHQISEDCKLKWSAAPDGLQPTALLDFCKENTIPGIVESINNAHSFDGLSAFDLPVAVLHLSDEKMMLDEHSNKTWIDIDVPIKNELTVSDWSQIISGILTTQLIPFIQLTISESYTKASNRSSQSALGFASKLYSMSKKYLVNQNPLLGIRHPQESVEAVGPATQSGGELSSSSTISINDANDQTLRRAADLCFMMGEYKQAEKLYESLRKESQAAKLWSATASSQQWLMISRVLYDPKTPVRQDFDVIAQQYLLQPQTIFTALHLLCILLQLKAPKDLIFVLCSRLSQSSIDGIFKLHLYTIQADIALSLKFPKKRLSFLLLERFSNEALKSGLNTLALVSYLAAYNLLQSGSHFFELRLSILRLSLAHGKLIDVALSQELLSLPSALTKEEAQWCWKSLHDRSSPVACTGLVTRNIQIDGRPLMTKFDLDDYDAVKQFCDHYWKSTGKLLDPVTLILADQEHDKITSQLVPITVDIYNPFEFVVMLTDATLKTDTGRNFKAHQAQLTILPRSSLSVNFDVTSADVITLKFSDIAFNLNGMRSNLVIAEKGFRLNLTKAQRVTPTFSENHSLWIKFKRRADFWDSSLSASSQINKFVSVNQECIIELSIQSNVNRVFNVVLLSGQVEPLDYVFELTNGRNHLKNISVESGGASKLLFKTCCPEPGPVDFVFAVYEDGTADIKLLRLKLHVMPLIIMRAVKMQECPIISLLVSFTLSASEDSAAERVRVYEAEWQGKAPIGVRQFELGTSPFTLTFPYDMKSTEPTGKLSMRLQDGRIISIPVCLPKWKTPLKLSMGDEQVYHGTRLVPLSITIPPGQSFTIPEQATGTIALGQVTLAQRPTESTAHVAFLSVNPDAIISPNVVADTGSLVLR